MFELIIAILGLCVGSFLNVVIYRLPMILKNQWREECLEFLKHPKESSEEKFTLCLPRSHCPLCKTKIPMWHNIPLLSFIFLRGKCAHCSAKISWQYPIIELLSALFALYIAYHFGITWQTAGVLIFTWCLLALVVIDIQHQLLPDNITLPLLWLGLLWNLNGQFASLNSAVIGAVSGYAFMWCIAWAFRKVRKIEGMGYGDFKLTAVLGAWLGWQLLPLTIILASVLGAVCGIAQIIAKKQSRTTPIPFGPYLALAGWIALFWGHDLMRWYWHLLL